MKNIRFFLQRILGENKGLFVSLGLLSIVYLFNFKTTPIKFYDEACWPSRAFYFDLYVRGDFSNDLWEGYYSYDQPKLVELLFGAVLYPSYLIEKSSDNNLSMIEYLQDKCMNYRADASCVEWGDAEEIDCELKTSLKKGHSRDSNQYLVERYGVNVRKFINTIHTLRGFSLVMMLLSCAAIYLLSREILKSKYWSIVSMLIYGLSNFVFKYGMLAMSDPSFMFFYIYSVYLIFRTVKRGRYSHKNLLVLGVFIGLTISTKLNGSLLYFVWGLTLLQAHLDGNIKVKGRLRFFGIVIIPMVISFIVFILLNPYVYDDVFRKTVYMFKWRIEKAQSQQLEYNGKWRLDYLHSRYSFVFRQVFGKAALFSPVFMGGLVSVYYTIASTGLGILTSMVKVVKGKASFVEELLFYWFVVVVFYIGFYLLLSWDRYIAVLLPLMSLYSTVGIKLLYDKVISKIKPVDTP